MALVRISTALIAQVKSRCEDIMEKQLDSDEYIVPEYSVDAEPDDGSETLALELMWGEHLSLKDTLPRHWLTVAKHAKFTTSVPDYGDYHRVYKFPVPIAAPPKLKSPDRFFMGEAHLQVPYEIIVRAAEDPTHRFHKVGKGFHHSVQVQQRRTKLAGEWADRINQLTLFLHKCKSLNEALKLWPAVRMYIPQHFLDAVETPVARPQNVVRKPKALENVDTDGLTAAAVAARLAGML